MSRLKRVAEILKFPPNIRLQYFLDLWQVEELIDDYSIYYFPELESYQLYIEKVKKNFIFKIQCDFDLSGPNIWSMNSWKSKIINTLPSEWNYKIVSIDKLPDSIYEIAPNLCLLLEEKINKERK